MSIPNLPSILAAMCNDYEQRVAWADYRKAMQQLELGIPTEQSEADRWIHISSATPRLAAKASIGVWYRRHFRGVVLRFQTTSSMSASV